MKDIWSSCLTILNLNSRIDEVVYKNVLSKMKQVSYENKILVLSYPDEFTYTCLDKEIKEYINKSAEMVAGDNITIVYVEAGNESAAITSVVAETKAIEKEKRNAPTPNGLNGEFTFDNFVVGECNKFAQASAISVAENPGLPQRNPLYLWGNSGLGKTHLMKAIGNKVSELYPEKKVLYTTCEEFTNAYIACMHNKVYEDFRNKYRTIDVLLIDDIQFLINKEGTQMEFFNTFESLISAGKQIVITSDKSPKNLPELDPRLTSRFQNGMLMDIQPPDYETRKAIILHKMNEININLSDDIVEYICENITTNCRELNGAFNIVSSLYALVPTDISLELVKSKLAPMISPAKNRVITIDIVADACSKYFSVPIEKLVSSVRSADVVNARSVAMYICRENLQLALEDIGQYFGGKKHSTVINACKNVSSKQDLIAESENIWKRITDA